MELGTQNPTVAHAWPLTTAARHARIVDVAGSVGSFAYWGDNATATKHRHQMVFGDMAVVNDSTQSLPGVHRPLLCVQVCIHQFSVDTSLTSNIPL